MASACDSSTEACENAFHCSIADEGASIRGTHKRKLAARRDSDVRHNRCDGMVNAMIGDWTDESHPLKRHLSNPRLIGSVPTTPPALESILPTEFYLQNQAESSKPPELNLKVAQRRLNQQREQGSGELHNIELALAAIARECPSSARQQSYLTIFRQLSAIHLPTTPNLDFDLEVAHASEADWDTRGSSASSACGSSTGNSDHDGSDHLHLLLENQRLQALTVKHIARVDVLRRKVAQQTCMIAQFRMQRQYWKQAGHEQQQAATIPSEASFR